MPRSRSRSPVRRLDHSPRGSRSYYDKGKSYEKRREPQGDRERSPRRAGTSERERERERGGSSGYRRDERNRRDERYGDRDRRRNHSRSRSPPPRPLRDRSPRSRDLVTTRHSEEQARSVPEDSKPKLEPNFKNSGLLAAATNTVKHSDGTSTVLKYSEPPEARKPTSAWRLYVFKGKEQVDLLHIARQSAYLVGRDQAVADIPVDHPSCSKQHAAIQFRQITTRNEFGDSSASVKPFIIDLESTNGTHVNDEQIPASRFYELKLGDVIKFGQSVREYVLMSEDAE